MKITKDYLRRIISEELQKCVSEAHDEWSEFDRLRDLQKDEPEHYGTSTLTKSDLESGDWIHGQRFHQDRGTEINLDLNRVVNIEIDGIDMSDYGDFSDAYIESASYEHSPGQYRDLTQDELDYLNSGEESEWVHQQIWNQVH